MATMKRQPIFLLNIAVLLMLMALSACSRETPAQQINSVSKKIAVQQIQPERTKPPSAEKSGIANSAARTGAQATAPAKTVLLAAKQAAVSPPTITPAINASKLQAPETNTVSTEPSDLVRASLQIADTYDPKGRFDPFEPLFKEQTAQANASDKTREKRKPQTPLERIALSQLKLTAIIRAPSGNCAMVEDATGKGYVVKKGTYIGLNSGRVTKIDDDRIVVEEEIENVMGALTLKNAELKLQKPAGEL
jgi:type IV pilus assembly protein PilP